MLILAHSFWDDLADQLKVTFDGPNKLIIINANVADLDIKTDVYSAWKRWVMRDNNAAYLAALRVTGGDPIGGGQFTGDVYFLINNWRMFIDHTCMVTGVLYSDDYDSPWMPAGGTNIVTNKVSALTNTVSTSGSTLSVSQITNGVWNEPTSTHTQSGSFGKLQQLVYDLTEAIKVVTDATLVKATETKDETILIKDDTTYIRSGVWAPDEKKQLRHRLSIDGIQTAPVTTNGTLAAINTKLDTVESIVIDLLKYEANKKVVNKSAKTLTIYEDDGVTPLKIFDLKDSTGAPSIDEIAQTIPR